MTTQEAAMTGHGRPMRGDARTLGPWFIAEFLNSCACTLLTAASYDYAHDVLGASPSAELWLCAVWGAAFVPIALTAGRISERWGPGRSALVMSAGSIATALLCTLAIGFPSIWMLAAVMLPYNMTCNAIWPAMESGLTRTLGAMRLSTRLGLFNLSWGGAGFVAFFTRGILEHVHWSLIFIVPAACHLAAFAVLLLWGAPASIIGRQHVPDDSAGEHELDAPGMRRRAHTHLLMAWTGNTLAYVAIYVLIPLLAKLANLAHITTLVGAGMITSVWSFTRLAGFALAWLWPRWHYKARWVVGGQMLLAASFLACLTLHDPTAFFAAQVVFGLSAALIYSAALYYAMHVSSGHGGHAGIHEALVGVGITIGPSIGAIAGTGELGPQAMQRIGLSVTAIVALGVLIMAVLAFRAQPAKVTPHAEN